MIKKNYFKYFLAILLGFCFGILFQNIYILDKKENNEKKIMYWVAPMDPKYRSDKPGKSPMGMDLIPVYQENENSDINDNDFSVKISPVIEYNLGIRTAKVEKQDISRVINTVGSITADENHVEHTHVYTDGWVKELKVKAEGEYVKSGQLLFKIYSPKIINSQEEYILASNSNNKLLQLAAIKKLKSLGFSDTQMKTLKLSKKASELTSVYSKQNGIISQLNIAEGMFVKPDDILVVVEDLSKIWMIAEVYENQSYWVKIGQKAEMSLPYFPGEINSGKVNYIYPALDPKSQTLRVRMLFENHSGKLKLNMFGDVKIFVDPKKDSIVIPKEAVIYTEGEAHVVVKLAKGKYITRTVKTGIESKNKIEISEGLNVGETIVTSAQFLIDSESNLKAGFNRISLENEKINSNSKTEH